MVTRTARLIALLAALTAGLGEPSPICSMGGTASPSHGCCAGATDRLQPFCCHSRPGPQAVQSVVTPVNAVAYENAGPVSAPQVEPFLSHHACDRPEPSSPLIVLRI